MSEGSITYQPEGASCGIFTVINSELRNHKVCNDGLACMEQYFDVNDDTLVKRCSSVELPPGTACNPLYTNCYAGLECLKNEYEDYTCGGCTPWGGNDASIDTTIIKTSHYEPNIPIFVIGIILVLSDILVYLYIFHYRKMIGRKQLYEETRLTTPDESIY